LIKATVEALMFRCRLRITALCLYSCNQGLPYVTLSQYDVAYTRSLSAIQGITSITNMSKSDYLVEFGKKNFTGRVD
jgi:hypothetical protein